jgi:hypothetical protein
MFLYFNLGFVSNEVQVFGLSRSMGMGLEPVVLALLVVSTAFFVLLATPATLLMWYTIWPKSSIAYLLIGVFASTQAVLFNLMFYGFIGGWIGAYIFGGLQLV